jgi:hypothetical protein
VGTGNACQLFAQGNKDFVCAQLHEHTLAANTESLPCLDAGFEIDGDLVIADDVHAHLSCSDTDEDEEESVRLCKKQKDLQIPDFSDHSMDELDLNALPPAVDAWQQVEEF